MVREQLLELRSTMRPKVTISMYNDMPAGQYGLAQFWSGDAINMPYYLPKKTDPGILRYWAPRTGARSTTTWWSASGRASNPVAAHYFMNAILDETVAAQNFGFTGYQPPLNQFTPDELVKEGFVPAEPRYRGGQRGRLRDRSAAARAADHRRHRVPPDLAGVQGRWLTFIQVQRPPWRRWRLPPPPAARSTEPRHGVGGRWLWPR